MTGYLTSVLVFGIVMFLISGSRWGQRRRIRFDWVDVALYAVVLAIVKVAL